MIKNTKTLAWAVSLLLTFVSIFIFEVEEVKRLFSPLTAIYVALFMGIVLFFSYTFNKLFHDEKLENSIKDLKEAMKSINMGWLISESEISRIEKKANEIWVFQNNLEKDYDLESIIGKTVKENLKNKKKYTYFLPVHSFTNGQVESFKNQFSEKRICCIFWT